MSIKRQNGLWFAAPAVLHMLVFAVIPIGYALYLSFFKWRPLVGEMEFVGLGAYAKILSDSSFWKSIWNSSVFTVASVPLGAAAALGAALLLTQRLKAAGFFRTLFYLPAICSQIAISMMWIYIYLPKTGLINMSLQMVGLSGETDFLNEPKLAMASLVFMSIWVGLGPKMILYMAGLMNIPQELNEASELDGAGPWYKFRKITLPLLGPTTLFVIVTSSIAAMQIFAPIYMMTKGGPDQATDMVGYHIYVEAWAKLNFGTAAAQSFILFAVVLVLSLVQLRMMKSQLEGWGAA